MDDMPSPENQGFSCHVFIKNSMMCFAESDEMPVIYSL